MNNGSSLSLHKRTPSENWDEDFDFRLESDDRRDATSIHNARHKNEDAKASQTPNSMRHSAISINSHSSPLFSSNEAGPSKLSGSHPMTAASHAELEQTRYTSAHSAQLENWDDDFEDRVDSPFRKSYERLRLRRSSPTEENWDDDPQFGVDISPLAKFAQDSMDYSDDEDDDFPGAELGFSDREEDRTVTGKSRLPVSGATSLPPLPPLPDLGSLVIPDINAANPAPFPRSPTLSTFSIPYSGRESTTYGSTAHLTLHHTRSSSRLSKLPPSPPVHKERERRRLRKKSRPTYLEGNIVEADDHPEINVHAPFKAALSLPHPSLIASLEEKRPTTPEDSAIDRSPLSASVAAPQSHVTPSAAPTEDNSPSAANKTPLLTRIGSMKKWANASGLRRKRASTGPEVQATSPQHSSSNVRSPPSSPKDNRGSRFFRSPIGSAIETMEAHESSHRDSDKSHNEREITRELIWPGNSSSQKFSVDTQQGSMAAAADIKAGRISSDEKYDQTQPSKLSLAHNKSNAPNTSPRRPRSQQGPNRPVFPRFISGSNADAASTEINKVTAYANPRSFSTNTTGSQMIDVSEPMTAIRSLPEKDTNCINRDFHHRTSLMSSQWPKKQDINQKYMLSEQSIPILPTFSSIDSISEKRRSMTGGDEAGLMFKYALENTHESSKATSATKLQMTHTMSLTGISDVTSKSLDPNLLSVKSLVTTPSKSFAASSAKQLATPQSASLGRATMTPPSSSYVSGNAFRRSSLGDLKIPARISQAQDALKKDLNRVREFAFHVDQMRNLRETRNDLASQLQRMSEVPNANVSRASASSVFNFALPIPRTRTRNGTRSRSNTNPARPLSMIEKRNITALSAAVAEVHAKYNIAWECAELLIDLGGSSQMGSSGNSSTQIIITGSDNQQPAQSNLSLVSNDVLPLGLKTRERAITLGAGTSKPSAEILTAPPLNQQKRLDTSAAAPAAVLGTHASSVQSASIGRHDLSQRQLDLLKVMLSHSEAPEYNPHGEKSSLGQNALGASDHWNWGTGMDSAITLPSEESLHVPGLSPTKKRYSAKLGIVGFRDMLKSLAKSHISDQQGDSGSRIASSISADSSLETGAHGANLNQNGLLPVERHIRVTSRGHNKKSTGPASVKSFGAQSNLSMVNTSLSQSHRPSPRRPSLASLFRLGQKTKQSNRATHESERVPVAAHSSANSNTSKVNHVDEEEDEIYSDWDRMELSSDLDDLHETLVDLRREANIGGTIRGRKENNPKRQSKGCLDRERITPQRAPDPAERLFWTSPPMRTEIEMRSQPIAEGHENSQSMPSTVLFSESFPNTNNGVRETIQDRLVLTPQNIKPLLENAREVTARLTDCVRELQELLSSYAPPIP